MSKSNVERLIDAVQKEWDDYPNINEIGNNRVDKIRQETEWGTKSGDFLVEGISELTVRAIVSLIAERESLKKDRDDWEQAKYNVEAIKDTLQEENEKLKRDVSIVNDMLDCVNSNLGPDKIIVIGDCKYAFVTDKNGNGETVIKLWVYQQDVGVEDTECADNWVEVSDLTGVFVWEYQEIKSYAVGVGMIG